MVWELRFSYRFSFNFFFQAEDGIRDVLGSRGLGDVYKRQDKGRADSKSSVGLGLSISSDIIKSHGGNIMLEKSKIDGLRVKIFLPV